MSTIIPTLSAIKLEIAFTTDPQAVLPTWTDVTPWLMSANTTRGRGVETDICDPGTATFALDNTDGRFDADNPSSPYAGKITPLRKVRFSAAVGTALTVPTLSAPTTAATGGTLSAATYFYKLTALGKGYGDTAASAEVSVTTTGTTSTVSLAWAAITGAIGYRLYRSSSAGTEVFLVELAGNGTVSYVDTGAAAAGATPAPSADSSPVTYIHTGYVDSWARTWPGGAEHSVVELRTTDRFKLIARRTNTGTTVQESTAARMRAILLAGGQGATRIVPAAEFSINPDGYACRTVIDHVYEVAASLDSVQDMARAEGGAIFMRGDGVLSFQSTHYRDSNTRALTSQATFGNTATAIQVNADIAPMVDDTRQTNYVTITDCNGTLNIAPATEASASLTANGPIMLDLGSTLLLPADAQDRVNDVLLTRQDPAPRYDSMTVDCFTNGAAMTACLALDISHRITLDVRPPGLTAGTSRAYFVERVSHDVTATSWTTTLGLTPTGAATAF